VDLLLPWQVLSFFPSPSPAAVLVWDQLPRLRPRRAHFFRRWRLLSRKLLLHYLRSLAKSPLGRAYFSTTDVQIGRGTSFGRNVRLNCKRIRIGDGVVFQDNIRIDSDDFEIGDYGTVYFGCFFPGPGKIKIGHNFWLGNNSIIDCQGGTTIGDNVGIGAHSQLWTHMKFGDVVAGSRFHSESPLSIGNDVWLVGHNLVSPVTIGDRSLAMLGSLIVKDIPPDRVVAGVPATDQTDKFGPQFSSTDVEHRNRTVSEMIERFAEKYGVLDIWDRVEVHSSMPTAFDRRKTIIVVSTRTYHKTRSMLELQLMRHLLPTAKFTPFN